MFLDPQHGVFHAVGLRCISSQSEDYQRGWISPLYVRGLGEGRRKSEDYQRGWISPSNDTWQVLSFCGWPIFPINPLGLIILVCLTDRKLLGSSTLTTWPLIIHNCISERKLIGAFNPFDMFCTWCIGNKWKTTLYIHLYHIYPSKPLYLSLFIHISI